MKNVLAFVLLWIGLTLQATVLQIPPLSAIQLNFDVVLLVLVAMTRGPRVALVLGIVIGFIEDVNYGAFIGLNAFAYGFIGYLAGTILSQLISRSVVSTFLVGLGCTFIYDWLTYGMTRLFDVTSYSWVGVMTVSIEQMMLNGVLILILYPFAIRWFTTQEKRRYEASER
ncbi:rod shape-determining protein MreD [Alicyclobacillus mengziensis]|uniref:Rod shape-determining protein MreD n=1 Tax=Alicyclobacillus mengziensis TaxID=2931921 RepID=A0A9X7VWH5_9BACL|nr:rod shape-determining protein MreD [Alicyclobacillus mengziensis]QSO45914.1 rod shape-determining protein MreD [Alicyclobacillus mengziensis]